MWYGKLPTQSELKDFRRQLAAERKLDPAIIELLRTAPKQTQPMDVLRTAVSALSFTILKTRTTTTTPTCTRLSG